MRIEARVEVAMRPPTLRCEFFFLFFLSQRIFGNLVNPWHLQINPASPRTREQFQSGSLGHRVQLAQTFAHAAICLDLPRCVFFSLSRTRGALYVACYILQYILYGELECGGGSTVRTVSYRPVRK